MRLIQLLKQNGLTAEQIKDYQAKSLILINGTKQKLACPLSDNDVVTLDGKVLTIPKPVYYLFNKPVGVVCTNNKSVKASIRNYLPKIDASCVGRLDKDSHGLIILTNDGAFAKWILTSDEVSKTYLVKVRDAITPAFQERMREPFLFRGRITKDVTIKYLDDYTFEITLREGMYHQIRKMVIASNNRVTDLLRTRIGPYQLDGLLDGEIKQFNK